MGVDDIENLPFDAHSGRHNGHVPAASLALAIQTIGFAQFPGVAPEDIAGIHENSDALKAISRLTDDCIIGSQ